MRYHRLFLLYVLKLICFLVGRKTHAIAAVTFNIVKILIVIALWGKTCQMSLMVLLQPVGHYPVLGSDLLDIRHPERDCTSCIAMNRFDVY